MGRTWNTQSGLLGALLSILAGACGNLVTAGSGATSADRGDAAQAGVVDASGDSGANADAASGPGPPWSGPQIAGTVTVSRGKTAGHLVPGFVGLSYEKSHLTDGFFAASNAALIGCFALLGPSVLRIGGNSVDTTTWVPSAAPVAHGFISTNVGTADVDALASFLAATHWKVIYALNLKTSTPAAAAAEAAYVSSKLGASLYGYEIGNEIDLYGPSYASSKTRWESFADAVHTVVPGARLAGPATATGNYAAWTLPFAQDESSRIDLLTQHYYRGDGLAPTSTMAELLAPDPGLTTMLGALSSASVSKGIADGYRLAEANSFFNHGAPAISDALGSALWAIDFMFTAALNGSAGVNFHGGGAGQDGPTQFLYTPLSESNGTVQDAQPIFYGLLLTALAGPGTLLPTTAAAGQLELTAYAVEPSDGSTHVVLVNKDPTSAVLAAIDVGASVSEATGTFLGGGSLTVRTGVTLGGASISPAGAWSPTQVWNLPVTSSTVTVLVPPASAALVQAR
jgi:hypothetical protein